MKIDKIYVVNLDDKIHRWKLFEDLNDERFVRFKAIDSRENPHINNDFNLTLNPTNSNNDFYFSQSKGAIGCYLSHYSIWKEILANEYKSVLILEDDADLNSVKFLLKNLDKIQFDDNDVVQLANRQQHLGDLVNFFCGTSSYWLNDRAANILINNTHDFSDMGDYEIPSLQWRVDTLSLHDCELVFKQHYTFTTKNSIRVPVDTFIGLCSHKKLPTDCKIKIHWQPVVDLHSTLNVSDILKKDDKNYFHMNCEELEKFTKRDEYLWWKT